MKYIIITIMAIFCPCAIFAQKDTVNKTLAGKHVVYADVGTNSTISLTYNYYLARRWGFGAGVQGSSWNPGYLNDNRYMPGIFGDVHFIMRPGKNNQFFTFLDLGIDIYKQEKRYFRDADYVYDLSYNNGFYMATGFGYLRRMTKRGGGLYVSFRLALDLCRVRTYSFISDDKNNVAVWGDGIPILSIGFRF